MAVNPFVYFVKIRPITDSSIIFTELEKHEFKFYYFRINQVHYLFFYGKKEEFDSIDHLYRTITIIEELDTKKRRLRSVRGFFLYAIEILESTNQENIQVLKTNLPLFFWKRAKNVIRQNNKGLLFHFLFGASEMSIANEGNSLEQTIQDLQMEVLNLKKKLEKIERTLNDERGQPKTSISDVSKDYGIDHQKSVIKARNGDNFIPIDKLGVDDKIEIIEKGFQMKQSHKLPLKEYFEGAEDNFSLLSLKGYKIHYHSIRKTPEFEQARNQEASNKDLSY
jgi:gas vesicle protein